MVDEKKILHIARLARLKINPEDAAEYSSQLTKVLTHFEEISNIDTTDVEPLITPSEIELFFREDLIEKKFSTEELMENAPDKSGHLFKVPPVVG